MRTDHDHRRQRCRRLGHEVSFAYCRTQTGNQLCPWILDCWWEVFDVETFLREEDPDGLAAVRTHVPHAKLATIVELVEQARARQR